MKLESFIFNCPQNIKIHAFNTVLLISLDFIYFLRPYFICKTIVYSFPSPKKLTYVRKLFVKALKLLKNSNNLSIATDLKCQYSKHF